jgi:hypothetical protein
MSDVPVGRDGAMLATSDMSPTGAGCAMRQWLDTDRVVALIRD